MYLDHNQHLILPSLNVSSLLTAENSKSVCRTFFGKAGKEVGLGISSYVFITPFEIPIHDGEQPIIFTGFNEQIYVQIHVARLAKGIPNPRHRPVIALPWFVDFTVEYVENPYCSMETLRQAFTYGGTLGLGTFRPFFGRYELSLWQVE